MSKTKKYSKNFMKIFEFLGHKGRATLKNLCFMKEYLFLTAISVWFRPFLSSVSVFDLNIPLPQTIYVHRHILKSLEWGGSNPKFQINIIFIIKLQHKLGNICEIKPLAALYTPHKNLRFTVFAGGGMLMPTAFAPLSVIYQSKKFHGIVPQTLLKSTVLFHYILSASLLLDGEKEQYIPEHILIYSL